MTAEVFYVDILEVLQKKVKVVATSKDEAMLIARKMYEECDIVLNADDFSHAKIKHADEDDTCWRDL